MYKNKTILFFISILYLFFVGCKSANYLTKIDAERIDVSAQNELAEDEEILQLIAPYKEELDVVMNQVIGEAGLDLRKERPESNLGNWMADAIHRKAEKYAEEKIDFALQNYGGIRIPIIKKGPIQRGKIYELMPFDNKIAIMYLNKSEVEELIQHFLNSRAWPVSYPLKVHKLTEEDIVVTLNEKPLTTDRIYKVALPDYIANGGSRSYFLKDRKRRDLNVLIRDVLIEDIEDFTKNNQSILVEKTGRIVINQ